MLLLLCTATLLPDASVLLMLCGIHFNALADEQATVSSYLTDSTAPDILNILSNIERYKNPSFVFGVFTGNKSSRIANALSVIVLLAVSFNESIQP